MEKGVDRNRRVVACQSGAVSREKASVTKAAFLLQEKLLPIRILLLDVDGVLTDGRIIMDDTGSETKQFDVKDGHGLKILMRFDITPIIVTGRQSAVVVHRAQDLGITEVYQKIWNKVEILDRLLRERRLDARAVAFVGDDLVDIPLLRRVGFAAAVADATPEVRAVADYVTRRPGGRGAVREVCELILRGQDRWDAVARRYEFATGPAPANPAFTSREGDGIQEGTRAACLGDGAGAADPESRKA